MNDQIALRLTQIGEQILKQQQVLAQATEWGPRDVVQAITATAAIVVPLTILWFHDRKDRRQALAREQKAMTQVIFLCGKIVREAAWQFQKVQEAHEEQNQEAVIAAIDSLEKLFNERGEEIGNLVSESHLANEEVMSAYVKFSNAMYEQSVKTIRTLNETEYEKFSTHSISMAFGDEAQNFVNILAEHLKASGPVVNA